MPQESLKQRRDAVLGDGAELFYDQPLEIVRGNGAYLFDNNGRRYVDMYNNVPCVGHANPVVVRAMAEQQATLNVHSRYLHTGIVEFAERLAGLHHDEIESVVFSCSGTEAIEVAIQMCRVVTGKRGLVCSDATYHGTSEQVAAMSYRWRSPPTSGDIRIFPYPDLYRPIEAGLSDDLLSDAYIARIKAAIDDLNAEGVGFAALIVCSIFANEGVPDIPAGLMQKVVELVHREGGLVISDEVQAGYGRTGKWWGYEYHDFRPDIVVTGKPMGNGLPLAATAAPKAIVDAFRAAKDYFNTCAATPLQAAVGMAVLDEIQRLQLVDNAARVGGKLLTELQSRKGRFDAIGDVRGCGLFLSVEMVRDRQTRAADSKLTLSLGDRLKDKGFLVSYSGKYDNVLKIRPPLVFSEADADEFLLAFDACMDEING